MKKESASQFVKRVLSTRPKPKVEIGDRFLECDSRFKRIVEVVKVAKGKAQIKTIYPATGRLTWARLDRFFRYSHGYRILGGRCHECQIKAGGEVPKWGHRGITVSMGTCGGCLADNKTLVPGCDYNWPQKGERAIWD